MAWTAEGLVRLMQNGSRPRTINPGLLPGDSPVPKNLLPSPLCPSEKVTEDQLATDLAILDRDRVIAAHSRRSFFSNFGAFTAVAAGAGLLAAKAPQAQAQSTASPTATIIDVLNFALNFEYLEANLYRSVIGAAPLSSLLGNVGAPVTGLPGQLTLDAITLATFENLVSDETNHITLLRAGIAELGGTPINQPAIDYSLGGTASITNQAQLLATTRQFTEVGNGAYTGGAALLVSNTYVLTIAGQILGAEAQHLGSINALCNFQGVTSPAVNSLDYPPVNPSRFFSLNPTTLPLTQFPAFGPNFTPQQVLGIVFGVVTATSSPTPAAGVTRGGFFPQGVNGAIVST